MNWVSLGTKTSKSIQKSLTWDLYMVWYPCYALSFLVVIPYNLSSLLTVYFGFLLFVLPQVVTWSCDLTCKVCKWAFTSKINCYKSSCRVQANSCWHLEHTKGWILWRATRGNHHNLSLSLSLSAWPSITARELLVPWCAFWYYYIRLATGLITFEFFFSLLEYCISLINGCHLFEFFWGWILISHIVPFLMVNLA